jgi:hypothetical protein
MQRIVRDKGKDSKDEKTTGPYTVQSSCEWEAIPIEYKFFAIVAEHHPRRTEVLHFTV